MEFTYRGANCIQIASKGGTLLTDPNLESLGLKDTVSGKADVLLLTQDQFKPLTKLEKAFVIETPGEYELKEFAIQGVAARAYSDEADKHSAIIYRVHVGTINVLILGHIFPELTESQLEGIGVIDILVVPVGGNGYTLDAAQASKLVRLISPKVVIPTHYADAHLKYPVEQAGIDEFAKDLGLTASVEEKYKIKGDSLPESLTLVELKRI
ncbi:MAG TPA: MBL fold metallo-hydrolase [Candidatus Saccharimonadales bacterium]|nr:MBL fold metallo-hydrolase [Candidatus Saccharimonadales bacterium]